MKTLDNSIVAILACPETHSPLALATYHDKTVLVCKNAGVHRCYPIVNDIPELLIESAILLSELEHADLLHAI
jgi:uncharacterized protein YbaR (Trm112 family)